MTCESCDGRGWHYNDRGGNIGVQSHCGACGSTCYISNNNAERSEFLRNLGKDYEINADAIRLILCGSTSVISTR